MRQIPNGCVYSREELLAEQKSWAENDPWKHYDPSQAFVTITNDGEIVEGVDKMDRDSLLNILYDIAMADLAGSDEGGTDMSESERRGWYNRFRYAIQKANFIGNYFAEYLAEDRKPVDIDDLI